MDVAEAFDIFQTKVDADPIHVLKARNRRDIFITAFRKLGDAAETIPSGSLARKTQLDPIHDVDLIAVFDAAAHPSWGTAGDSAGQALEYCQGQVQALLGSESAAFQRVVGQTLIRNHVVKCFLDPRFMAEDSGFKGSFAVEVMPALRRDRILLVPERKNHDWQKVDPEWLIAEVRSRQESWQYMVRTIRIIKFWMRHVKSGVKPLAAEVLALKCLPNSVASSQSRSTALQRFFTAASPTVMMAIRDPAGHCGEIQPDLKRLRASALLREASDIATIAVAWENEGEDHKAICCWRTIFGGSFPEPPGGCPGTGRGFSPATDRSTGTSRPVSGHAAGDDNPSDGNTGIHGDSGGPDAGGSSPGDGDMGRRTGPIPVVPPLLPPSPSRPVKDAPQG